MRAHLLHQDLGGKGTAINLVVACKQMNSDLYRKFESIVLGWVKQGSTVDLEVLVRYSGASPYPASISTKASRLDCQASQRLSRPVCEKIGPEISGETDITRCNLAQKR